MNEQNESEKMVDKTRVLEICFDAKCRPSMSWLNHQVSAKKIPHLKLGGRVFFIPSKVRAHFSKNAVAGR